MDEPELTQVRNGWAARGEGWSVHGKTREEALEKFAEAAKLREAIRSQPYYFESTNDKDGQRSDLPFRESVMVPA